MDLYKENNIKVLLSLHKVIEVPEEYHEQFQIYHFKWSDLKGSNSLEQLDHIVDVILKHLHRREGVNVNCEGGITESAVVLMATLMKHEGIPHDLAFKKVSEHRYAMEDEESSELLGEYERFLKHNNKILPNVLTKLNT